MRRFYRLLIVLGVVLSLAMTGSRDVVLAEAGQEEPVRIEFGAKGEEVLALQQRLIALGYLNGSADGDFGSRTQGAVQALQNAHGLEATGVVTEKEVEALQQDIKAYAKRAIVVAMTNGQSTDVFAPDGNTYDTSKFHTYTYTAGLHAVVCEDGEWEQTGTDAWHIEDMLIQYMGAEDLYAELILDITFDGENYVLSGVTRTMGKKTNLDWKKLSSLNVEEMEPSEDTPFLTVSPAMLMGEVVEQTSAIPEETTKAEETPSTTGEETPSYSDSQARKDWINSQFSIWNGKHKGLEDLIKKNLNDEKSYKHIETTYIDCDDQTTCDLINSVLSDAGYSQRVEVGDLFITTKFSAKNAFNATIKKTAYGIASYQNNTIELIGFE